MDDSLIGIAYITRKYPPSVGGMQQLSKAIADQLSLRYTVHLIKPRPGSLPLPAFALFAALQLLYRVLRRQVRVVLLGDPALSALGLLARALGLRVAVVVHGLDITYTGLGYQRYLELGFWRRFDAYLCISRYVAQLMKDRCPGCRVHLVHPGVRMMMSPSAIDITADRLRLVILGRLVKRKGAAWFVDQVMPRLLSSRHALHLDIIGDGPEREVLDEAVRRHALHSQVTLHGEVSEERKAELLRACHLALLPNQVVADDPEGFGLVAVEVAAYGRYVLASDIDGLRDAVITPETGQLIPAGDSAAWSAAVDDALSDLVMLREKGLRASSVVRDRFRLESMGQAYAEVIDAIA